jgi:WD40 repeat protein
LYHTWTYENFGSLRGHDNRIRSLNWSWEDNILVSCGIDGAIYQWSSRALRRETEFVIKAVNFTCAQMTIDAKTIFTASADKFIRQISGSQLVREIPCAQVPTQA